MHIGIRWLDDGIAQNYIDIFDEVVFVPGATKLPIQHEVLRPNKQHHGYARCLLTMHSQKVTLDYEAFAEFNNYNDILLGLTRFIYDPEMQEKIHSVLWKQIGSPDFLPCDTEFIQRKTKLQTFDESKIIHDELVESAKNLTDEEIQNLLPPNGFIPPHKTITTTAYIRNPYVIIAALRKAAGMCQMCGNQAPFISRFTNDPYLEVHHVLPLSKGGTDNLTNVIAVCANCHRKSHYGIEV